MQIWLAKLYMYGWPRHITTYRHDILYQLRSSFSMFEISCFIAALLTFHHQPPPLHSLRFSLIYSLLDMCEGPQKTGNCCQIISNAHYMDMSATFRKGPSKTHVINTSYSFRSSIITVKVFACNKCIVYVTISLFIERERGWRGRRGFLVIVCEWVSKLNCINCTLLATATKTICGRHVYTHIYRTPDNEAQCR